MSTGDSDRTYRYGAPWIPLATFSCIPTAFFTATVVLLVYIALTQLRPQATDYPAFSLVILCILAPLIPIAIAASLWSLLIAATFLLTRLRVSPQGLDFSYWPYYAVRCSWSELDKLQRRQVLFLPADQILLRHATPYGPAITMTMRRVLRMSTQYFIPLTGLSGWPKGKLAPDPRAHAPHLFNEAGA